MQKRKQRNKRAVGKIVKPKRKLFKNNRLNQMDKNLVFLKIAKSCLAKMGKSHLKIMNWRLKNIKMQEVCPIQCHWTLENSEKL